MTEPNEIPTTLDITDIMKVIPHRFPFLLIDRVIELDKDNYSVVALKNVTINEEFFAGHFPGMPVMPGVLQLEAMAQTACVMRLFYPEFEGQIPFFAGVEKVRFRKPVVPGDQLRIEARTVKAKGPVAKFEARCLVDGKVVAEALITCMFGDGPA